MRNNPYQLGFFEKRSLALKPTENCPGCGGQLRRITGPTIVYGIKCYFEVTCGGCGECYHLYFNKIGVPDWQLRKWEPDKGFFGELVWPVPVAT